VLAATLARTTSGGAVVGIVLLVTTHGGTESLAGLLAATITAPHLMGPFVARTLDRAQDPRNVLAAACVIHGGLLAAAVLAYPVASPWLVAALLTGSGLAGPLVMGGLSSRLPDIAAPDRRSQRSAQGWDVASYGISGTLGPALVALLAASTDASVALLVLAATAISATAFVRLLPPTLPRSSTAAALKPITTLRLMLGTGPLRRTLYLTMCVALAVAALPVAAVGLAADLGTGAAAAGVLTAIYGAGGLVASITLMVRPLRADADRSTTMLATAVATALALTLLSYSFWIAVVMYAVAGACNSYFFAATLAARSEYAPDTARAQIFVWVGALKIAAGAAGTVLAGVLIAPHVLIPIIVAAVIAYLAAAAASLERTPRPLRGSDTQQSEQQTQLRA